MTKADLIEEVSRVAEIKSKEAEVVVDAILASMVDAVRVGGNVELRGFGSFRTRKRAGRTARNPATGEPLTVAPKAVAFFKPSKEVLELINPGRRG